MVETIKIALQGLEHGEALVAIRNRFDIDGIALFALLHARCRARMGRRICVGCAGGEGRRGESCLAKIVHSQSRFAEILPPGIRGADRRAPQTGPAPPDGRTRARW